MGTSGATLYPEARQRPVMTWLVERPVAHRGLHSPEIPENSLAAFDAAIEHGYAIELDVRLTRDGIPIVYHDPTLERLTGIEESVAECPWERIADLQLTGTDERIPQLSTVLDRVDGRSPLLIEVKSRARGHALETAIESRLDGYDGPFAVQSFNPVSLAYFRKHRPSWPRGQVAGELAGHPNVPWYQNHLLKRLLLNWLSRPDFIAYELSELPTWPVSVHRSLGLPVLAWTVRTEAELRQAAERADNVIFEEVRP